MAAVWYQLITGRKPQVPDLEVPAAIQFEDNGKQASAPRKTDATAAPSAEQVLAEEQIRQRLLLDLRSHRPSADSELSLAVSEKLPLVYIGR